MNKRSRSGSINMAKVHSLTSENLDRHSDHSSKRLSVYARESSDVPTALTTNPNMRRMSKFEPRQSVQYSRRMSQVSRTSVTGSSIVHKHIGLFPVKLQNTYKLQPDSDEMFQPGPVSKVMNDVLEEYLNGEKYNATQCRSWSQMLTDHIKTRVKDLYGCNRYKYIVTVTLGQNCKQGVQVVSRCLWNKDTDNYADAYFKNDSLYAVATLYACYFD